MWESQVVKTTGSDKMQKLQIDLQFIRQTSSAEDFYWMQLNIREDSFLINASLPPCRCNIDFANLKAVIVCKHWYRDTEIQIAGAGHQLGCVGSVLLKIHVLTLVVKEISCVSALVLWGSLSFSIFMTSRFMFFGTYVRKWLQSRRGEGKGKKYIFFRYWFQELTANEKMEDLWKQVPDV